MVPGASVALSSLSLPLPAWVFPSILLGPTAFLSLYSLLGEIVLSVALSTSYILMSSSIGLQFWTSHPLQTHISKFLPCFSTCMFLHLDAIQAIQTQLVCNWYDCFHVHPSVLPCFCPWLLVNGISEWHQEIPLCWKAWEQSWSCPWLPPCTTKSVVCTTKPPTRMSNRGWNVSSRAKNIET